MFPLDRVHSEVFFSKIHLTQNRKKALSGSFWAGFSKNKNKSKYESHAEQANAILKYITT